MYFKGRIFSSTKQFIRFIEKKTLFKSKLFQTIFWVTSIFALCFVTFSAFMGTAKLASSRLPEFKGFATLFIQKSIDNKGKPIEIDQWPIFTLWIGIALAIINGLVALFVVKKKWIRNEKINTLIQLEKILYNNSKGKYKDAKNKDIVFFDKISEIIGNKHE
ncbi:DUF4231 domain-containing protein [Mesomycoplasma neurolyticum]|uniref:ResB-like domain-containing protein n=1 Tax=Mesomycoplasma neurolyticum TaxID=2120 RepID=A0A449A5Z3_9BACT|nr:DUF4231 domain-containing protein [Mesomycoplasma neurolyticum]VEU59656.1 Uncharacterised protein [Mesomycoplasma neurolyticum]